MKIWVDTDIGSEIDDALALAYLLCNQAVEILGISTVTDKAQIRAMLASALCLAAGRPDIPIYPGCEESLPGKPFGQQVSQADALRSLDHGMRFENCDTVGCLRDAIYANDEEVILLAIGPLSNIAHLFVGNPQVPKRLRRLVTMCGNFSDSATTPEWNARLDPESANIVFRTPIAGGHYLIGLEATHSLQIATESLEGRYLPPVLQAVLKLHEAKYDMKRPLTMYDAAAAMLAVNPALSITEKGTGSIDLDHVPGMTSWEHSDAGIHFRFPAISLDETLREFLAPFDLYRESC